MAFGNALNELKAGNKVQRTGWNGKDLWLELQRPDAHSKMTLPYLYLNYPDDAQNTPGARVFVASRIVKWTDNEQTALCPFCGIDSVLPSAVSHDFLRRARAHWFDKGVQA